MTSLHLSSVFLLIVTAVLSGCQTSNTKDNCALCGHWNLAFETPESQIPARLTITEDSLYFTNGKELVTVLINCRNTDSLTFKMPHYDSHIAVKADGSQLRGEWTNKHKANYTVPFHGDRRTMPFSEENPVAESKYACQFGDEKVIGLFKFGNQKTEGTFLTETGDYRFLEGEPTANGFYLSCYDGAHLFYFSANHSGDSLINGLFLSGKHHKEAWYGVKTTDTKLTDPDSLTTWVNTNVPLSFEGFELSGNPITVTSERFIGKVTAVTIIGTWCPNCTDLEKFLLENKTLSRMANFSVLPVCFESGEDMNQSIIRIKSHFSVYGNRVNPMYGGPAIKQKASEVFGGLSGVSAFPTTLLVDKRGYVRHVHTGFYGPGTGAYHTLYTNRMIDQIMVLLSE